MIQTLPKRFDTDLPVFGKFQRIADEVDQDLPDPRRIPQYVQILQAF